MEIILRECYVKRDTIKEEGLDIRNSSVEGRGNKELRINV